MALRTEGAECAQTMIRLMGVLCKGRDNLGAETLQAAGRSVSGVSFLEAPCYNPWAVSADTLQWLLIKRRASSILWHTRPQPLPAPPLLLPPAGP